MNHILPLFGLAVLAAACSSPYTATSFHARATLDPVPAVAHGLAEDGSRHLRMAGQFSQNGDAAAADSVLSLAMGQGHAEACYWRARTRHPVRASASQISAFVDASAPCASLLPPALRHEDESAQIFAGLHALAHDGNGRAVARLDSFRALGVFERHPRLALPPATLAERSR